MNDLSFLAITRAPSLSLGQCQLSFVEAVAIDLRLAQKQHQDYAQALRELGCKVVELPPIDDLPDAVFVEDVALILDEQAIITHPGAPTRRAEATPMATVLEGFRTVNAIKAPGTLDGGDVLRIGKQIFVGLSQRTNGEGIAQLRQLVSDDGYHVIGVPIHDCLHLKSAVTAVSDNCVLINPAWVDAEAFAQYRQITVDPAEAHAANALLIGDQVLYPEAFPRTAERLRQAGIKLKLVDVSELQKAEGAVTCCSLVFRA